MTNKTLSTQRTSTDPLSYFASITEKKQKPKKQNRKLDLDCRWGKSGVAYGCDTDSLQTFRLEKDIAQIKLEIAETRAEEDEMRLLARRLTEESARIRRDLQSALGKKTDDAGVQDAKDMKGTLQRCVDRVVEDIAKLKEEIPPMEEEVYELQRKLRFFGINPDQSAKAPQKSSPLKEAPMSFEDCRKRRHSWSEMLYSRTSSVRELFADEKKQQDEGKEIRTTKEGVVVADSLLWESDSETD